MHYVLNEDFLMSKIMQPTDEHHAELIKGIYEQLKPVLNGSEQPIYVYLDDNHKACNEKLASLLGYNSPKEWAETSGFLEVFVAEKSRETLYSAYQNVMNKMVASTIQLTWMKKDGVAIDSTVVMLPMFFQGHIFAVHFVTNTAQAPLVNLSI